MRIKTLLVASESWRLIEMVSAKISDKSEVDRFKGEKFKIIKFEVAKLTIFNREKF